MTAPYPRDTVTESESASPCAPQPSLGQLISQVLEEATVRLGHKNLPPLFDGREGKAVAGTTVSRWKTEPDRFPAVFLPILVQLDPEFGRQLLKMLPVWMGIPEQVLLSLPPGQAESVQRTYERLVLEQIGPGRWGR